MLWCWSHSIPPSLPLSAFYFIILGFSLLPSSSFFFFSWREGPSQGRGSRSTHPHMAAGNQGPSSCPGLKQHHPPSLKNAVTPLNGYPRMDPGPTKLLLEVGGKYSPLPSHRHDRSPSQEEEDLPHCCDAEEMGFACANLSLTHCLIWQITIIQWVN